MRTPHSTIAGWFQSRRIMRPTLSIEVLPGLVADMLPARNLLQHQQTEFVAGIEEVA